MIQSFFTNNFAIYLLVISVISYLLISFEFDSRFKRQRKLLLVIWVICVGWFTRKMHIDSYVPVMLSETFSE